MDSTKLSKLLDSLCNDALSPDEERELTEILLADSEARQIYYDNIDVHLSMIDHSLANAPLSEDVLLEHDQEGSHISNGVCQSDSSSKYLMQYRGIGLLLALAASLLVGLSIMWDNSLAESDDFQNGMLTAIESENSLEDMQESMQASIPEDNSFFLAQITDVSPDTEWKTTASTDFLLRLSRGDRIDLEKGSVLIEYYAGAILVLEGPCSYVVTGEESGRLQSGCLAGNVTVGEFLLTTPTAKVLDLGTEFGVSVDPQARTEVSVFNGKVAVTAEDGVHNASKPLLLQQGGSASVERGGHIVEVEQADLTRYLRDIPNGSVITKEINELSLVDVLAAKNDGSINLTAVIAPDTGEPDRHPWLRSDGPGYSVSYGYRSASWHRFVDGVFIPHRDGGQTVIDSFGTVIDLPGTTGRTWGPIWSRRSAASSVPTEGQEDYWGTDTLEVVADRAADCRYGMIGLHSNVGITFDLKQIANVCGSTPTEFSGQVSNLDNSLVRLPNWAAGKNFTADFRVYVDGKSRKTLHKLGRESGDVSFAVALEPSDRFLTIVATDDGERNEFGESTTDYADAYDHIVLIDPLILMKP